MLNVPIYGYLILLWFQESIIWWDLSLLHFQHLSYCFIAIHTDEVSIDNLYEVSIDNLYAKLGIQVKVALRTRRLRWYGHIVCATSCTNLIMSIAIPGSRGRRKPRKSWSECVNADVNVCNLGSIDPQNRLNYKLYPENPSENRFINGREFACPKTLTKMLTDGRTEPIWRRELRKQSGQKFIEVW